MPEIKDEFGRFVDLLSVNGFCREDFGQHFVDAYNEEQYRRYDDLIVHGKCQRCGVAVQDVLKARSGCGLAPRVLWIAG